MPEKRNGYHAESQSLETVLNSTSFLIDQPEFQRAITLHVTIELFKRLGLPDRVFLVFALVLSYTRGDPFPQKVPQGAIASSMRDLIGLSDRERKTAIQRVGRYLATIAEKQKIVVMQIEPGKRFNDRKEWTIMTALAWIIIHDAIEYLPVEMPGPIEQGRGVRDAVDRALEEYMKGSSRLSGRLGKKRMPLTFEQQMDIIGKQYCRIIDQAHLAGHDVGALEERHLLIVEGKAMDTRSWKGKR